MESFFFLNKSAKKFDDLKLGSDAPKVGIFYFILKNLKNKIISTKIPNLK